MSILPRITARFHTFHANGCSLLAHCACCNQVAKLHEAVENLAGPSCLLATGNCIETSFQRLAGSNQALIISEEPLSQAESEVAMIFLERGMQQMIAGETSAWGRLVTQAVKNAIFPGHESQNASNPAQSLKELVCSTSFFQAICIRDVLLLLLQEQCLDSTCAFSLLSLGLEANLPSLAAAAQRFILANFADVISADACGFVTLSSQALLSLLGNDDLQVASEEVVFSAVVQWVGAEIAGRKAMLPKLLREGVRLMLMTMDQMTAVDSHPLVVASKQCTKLVAHAYLSSFHAAGGAPGTRRRPLPSASAPSPSANSSPGAESKASSADVTSMDISISSQDGQLSSGSASSAALDFFRRLTLAHAEGPAAVAAGTAAASCGSAQASVGAASEAIPSEVVLSAVMPLEAGFEQPAVAGVGLGRRGGGNTLREEMMQSPSKLAGVGPARVGSGPGRVSMARGLFDMGAAVASDLEAAATRKLKPDGPPGGVTPSTKRLRFE